MNLIVQHFFTKAALIILESRVNLPMVLTKDGEARLEKWFNLWINDTNSLSSDLEEWRTMEAHRTQARPMVIDVYLDTARLAQNQTLVAIDDENRRWDVKEGLRKSNTSSSPPPTEVVYERWTVSLDTKPAPSNTQSADPPPNVYKKGVVALRSLYTYCRFLPGWKFSRRMARQAGNGPTPKTNYRITNNQDSRTDTLASRLFPDSGSVIEEYHFNPLPCTFGNLTISVEYRTNCNFEVDAAERLLSERFGPTGTASSTRASDSTSGELSQDSRYKPWARMPSAEEERTEDVPGKALPQRTISSSRASPRSETMPSPVPRRPSVSFQPFKAGSLSSSPAGGLQISSSPGSSSGRNIGMTLPSHNRSRSSINALPQQALRTPGLPPPDATVTSSASSSPKPAPIQRYSSSFGNRKARFPSSLGSRTEDDGNSSRGSVSSAPRGSVTLPEEESSGQDDTDNISDFIKMLEKSSSGLPSLNKTDKASLDAQSQRTATQFSKFTRMRDSTAQLSESMSSSLMLQRSYSSSSRQLSNVPGLTGGVSISSSPSPSKPISPHTPHIPAVPSRLSNNSIAEYSREQPISRLRSAPTSSDSIEEDRPGGMAIRDRGTTAIDIPASPRTFPTSRRSSSVHHQGRPSAQIDDDVLPFGLRSASVPSEERQPYQADDDEPLLFAMG